MNIEKLKELSVPVNERLPKERGNIFCLVDINGKVFSSQFNYEPVTKEFWDINGHDKARFITHWIDFDLLTKKTTAIELMEASWRASFDYIEDKLNDREFISKDKFITDNINKL